MNSLLFELKSADCLKTDFSYSKFTYSLQKNTLFRNTGPSLLSAIGYSIIEHKYLHPDINNYFFFQDKFSEWRTKYINASDLPTLDRLFEILNEKKLNPDISTGECGIFLQSDIASNFKEYNGALKLLARIAGNLDENETIKLNDLNEVLERIYERTEIKIIVYYNVDNNIEKAGTNYLSVSQLVIFEKDKSFLLLYEEHPSEKLLLNVKCELCNSRENNCFTNPTCQHSFCYDCLKKKINNKSMNPICFSPTCCDHLDKNKLELFMNEMEKSNEKTILLSPKCKLCNSRENNYFTNTTCQHSFCNNCLKTKFNNESIGSICFSSKCCDNLDISKLELFMNKMKKSNEKSILPAPKCELCKLVNPPFFKNTPCNHLFCRSCLKSKSLEKHYRPLCYNFACHEFINEKELDYFMNPNPECSICFKAYPIEFLFQNLICHHKYCSECAISRTQSTLNSYGVLCLVGFCSEFLSLSDLENFLLKVSGGQSSKNIPENESIPEVIEISETNIRICSVCKLKIEGKSYENSCKHIYCYQCVVNRTQIYGSGSLCFEARCTKPINLAHLENFLLMGEYSLNENYNENEDITELCCRCGLENKFKGDKDYFLCVHCNTFQCLKHYCSMKKCLCRCLECCSVMKIIFYEKKICETCKKCQICRLNKYKCNCYCEKCLKISSKKICEECENLCVNCNIKYDDMLFCRNNKHKICRPCLLYDKCLECNE